MLFTVFNERLGTRDFVSFDCGGGALVFQFSRQHCARDFNIRWRIKEVPDI
jgi:hypothetical protein